MYLISKGKAEGFFAGRCFPIYLRPRDESERLLGDISTNYAAHFDWFDLDLAFKRHINRVNSMISDGSSAVGSSLTLPFVSSRHRHLLRLE
jgi:hypothetical protein